MFKISERSERSEILLNWPSTTTFILWTMSIKWPHDLKTTSIKVGKMSNPTKSPNNFYFIDHVDKMPQSASNVKLAKNGLMTSKRPRSRSERCQTPLKRPWPTTFILWTMPIKCLEVPQMLNCQKTAS